MATSIPVLVQSLTSYYVSRNNGFNYSTKFVYKTLFKPSETQVSCTYGYVPADPQRWVGFLRIHKGLLHSNSVKLASIFQHRDNVLRYL